MDAFSPPFALNQSRREMIALLPIRRNRRADWFPVLIAAFYGTICLLQLQDFVRWSSANFVIGCIGLPFMLTSVAARPASARYGYAALFFCGIYFLLPVKTCQYVALVCALLFVYESVKGKTSLLPFMTLMLMSPVAQYFADDFSFPLRLRLTTLAGHAMQLMGRSVEVSGNVITSGGTDFSVDPACMGLHMLLSSLLCCLLIIAVQQKRWGKRLSAGWIVVVSLCAITLNVLSNLIRIVMLVQFSIMPGTVLHELTGILCLVLYVIVPAMTGLRWLVRKTGKTPQVHDQAIKPGRTGYSLHTLTGALLIAGMLIVPGYSKAPASSLPVIPGYTASYYDADIVKLENDHALIYLKDLKGFYCSEHHPMLCWTGEGYLFKQVEKKTVAGVPVISGTLQKSGRLLYTAWWYSNGKTQTSSGLGWRWDALRHGNPYSIVNVTAADEAVLKAEIARIISDKELNDWIGRTNRMLR